jgi:predicted nucleic acid-binding Zn ribbon protein
MAVDKFCPYCGASNPAQFNYCAQCRQPLSAPPVRASRSRVRVALTFLVILGIVVAVLFLLPVPQTKSIAFTLTDPGSFTQTYSQQVIFSHAGTLTFNYATRDGGTVTFTVQDGTGHAVYTHNAATGSASFAVNPGETYTFGVYAWSGETVDVSGSEGFSAPLL